MKVEQGRESLLAAGEGVNFVAKVEKRGWVLL